MSIHRAFLVPAAFLLLLNSCKEKNREIPLPHISEWQVYDTSNSALPDNQVNAIAIDGNNVKWIGTARGLARMEGNHISVITSGNSPLPSSYIRALAVGVNNAVRIGTDYCLYRAETCHHQ